MSGIALTRGMSQRQVLAYGALGLPLAMAALPVYVHVPQLYAEVSGLSLSLLGILLLASRLADAFIDPLLGGWSDRTAKRQRLIVLALPLLAIGMVALLHPPQAGAAAWLLGSMLLTYFAFSLASVAYQAWGAEIGRDAGERTRITASREGFGLLGVVLAAILPSLLSAQGAAQGLSRMSWLFALLLAVMAMLTLRGAPPAARRIPATGKLFSGLWPVLADRRFRKLLTVFIVNGIAAALPATLVLFFVDDVLRAEAWGGAFLALYFVSGIGFLPLWVMLSRRYGRVPAWVASMIVAVVAFSWAWTLGAGDVAAFAVICLLSGAALGADLTLPAALLADIAEEGKGRSEQAEHCAQAGAYFGWWNLVAKLNLALAAGLALPLLDQFGYQPGVAESTLALSAVYGLLPLCFKTLAAVLAWRWRAHLESSS